MKNLLKFLIVTAFILVTAGCQGLSAPASGDIQTFELNGKKVSFIAPPAPWEAQLQVAGEGGAELGDEAGKNIAVTFHRPDKPGFISVAMIDQARDKDKKLIELENDQSTLDMIANWVEKRDGTRIKEEYIPVLGGNAFHMIFEVGKPEERQKGEQVHFTKGGYQYSLSLLVPAQDYSAEVSHFQNMVSSLKVDQ